VSNIYNMADTWTGGAAYTAILMNVTDTSSTAGSLVIDLQIGGASKLAVGKTSALLVGVDAANTTVLRNGVNTQAFNLYNTYTDASNYGRLSFKYSGNHATITTEVAGTGTSGELRLEAPSGVRLLHLGATTLVGTTTAVDFRSNATFSTDGTLDVGTATSRPRYVRAASAIVTPSTTVASLPAAATAGAGARSFVTDATATTFLSIVAGGGANKVPVVSDGTNWLIG
jgi:hypothetical protein